MIRVVCWLWNNTGPKRNRVEYTKDHVDRFANMVRRNLSIPHEIVCITDQPDAVPEGVRYVPLWDDGLREKGGCYVRLKAFSEEMRGIIGPRFVSIDLDCVIVDDITPVVDRPEPFIIWQNIGGGSLHCGSMFMMDAGAVSEVWDRFDPDDLVIARGGDSSHPSGRWVHPEAKNAGNTIGSDQAWISTVLPDAPQWTKKDGVLSRYHVLRDSRMPGRAKRLSSQSVPKGARIIFFHGSSDPSQPDIQDACPWIKKHWR